MIPSRDGVEFLPNGGPSSPSCVCLGAALEMRARGSRYWVSAEAGPGLRGAVLVPLEAAPTPQWAALILRRRPALCWRAGQRASSCRIFPRAGAECGHPPPFPPSSSAPLQNGFEQRQSRRLDGGPCSASLPSEPLGWGATLGRVAHFVSAFTPLRPGGTSGHPILLQAGRVPCCSSSPHF